MMAPTLPQKIENMKEFNEFLKGAGSNLVVVDFSAKWCGPCKMIRPFVYEMAVRYGNVLFCIVDVDVAEVIVQSDPKSPIRTLLHLNKRALTKKHMLDHKQDVANQCNIIAMPTFQLFKKGEKIFEMTGANAKKLEAKIKELM